MAPLIVQILATLAARLKLHWRDAARVGMAVMFFFTAASHFSSLKHDMAAMVPPPLTGALWVVYVTGILEAAGAAGLLRRQTARLAAWCLVALLALMLPANVYAAMNGVALGGRPPSQLWWRVPLQAFWMCALWWSSARLQQSEFHQRARSFVTRRDEKACDADKGRAPCMFDRCHRRPVRARVSLSGYS